MGGLMSLTSRGRRRPPQCTPSARKRKDTPPPPQGYTDAPPPEGPAYGHPCGAGGAGGWAGARGGRLAGGWSSSIECSGRGRGRCAL